jgi:hypothetical protein
MPRPDISVSRPTSKPVASKLRKISLQQLAILPVVAVLLGLIILSTSATAAIVSGIVLAGLTALMLWNIKVLRKEA